jgi:tetratricopeptide (TPR) repeat protein
MRPLQDRLHSAIQYREAGKHQEARQLLLELISEIPDDPQVNYQCAWIHDLLGLEREAIPFYEKAIRGGLAADNLKSALLGLGSTYRAIGEYRKAIDTFQHALTLFPASHEFNVFLAMALHNIHEHARAMELLLNSLADTSADEGILRYRRAIRFYADKLEQTW